MIEAGAERVWELRGFDPNFVAEEVFRVMATKISELRHAPPMKR
jgi:hypothetical protein